MQDKKFTERLKHRYLGAVQSKHDYAPLIDFFESEQKWYQEKIIPMIFDYDELK